jgi:hypothetical protein
LLKKLKLAGEVGGKGQGERLKGKRERRNLVSFDWVQGKPFSLFLVPIKDWHREERVV